MASACALVMSSSDSNKLFGPLRHWRAKEAASTCVLVTISAICICILVVCGVLLAREYSLASGYERTTCFVLNVTNTGQEKTCQCSGSKGKEKGRLVRIRRGSVRGAATSGQHPGGRDAQGGQYDWMTFVSGSNGLRPLLDNF